jgi:UDP-2,3-diacylglucosamine pyrophosphatase LpxH
MKLAIISDTHFGDPAGTLVQPDKQKGKYKLGPHYAKFLKAAGTDNDFLVMSGDVLDFSIAPYDQVFAAAKVFFNQIKQDNVANEIIYLPGNHDADLWHTVEYQTNVIKPISDGELPRPFRLSVPGVIDCRQPSPKLVLHGVTAKKGRGPRYAGLFLDNLADGGIPFNFAYPNLFIAAKTETVLVTHGHYLEPYWAMAGEWVVKIAQEDLKIGGSLDLREMVGLNFPLSQLACSGIGQAGPLTPLVRQVQRDAKDGKLERISKYLDRAGYQIDEIARFPWYKHYFEWLTDAAIYALKKYVLDAIGNMRSARFNQEFLHKKEVQDRFTRFYEASLIELGEFNTKNKTHVPPPGFVIFGHTHEPIPWGDPNAPKSKVFPAAGMQPIALYNTGGWLMKKDESGNPVFCGAEVFTYSTGKGFGSTSIG